jgi:hypothetical protein
MRIRPYANRAFLVGCAALSFVGAGCTGKPPADHTHEAGIEDASRAAWIPLRHSPPQTEIEVAELQASEGSASLAEPITAPELVVEGTPTQFDVLRVVPLDLSNTTYHVALSPRCSGDLLDSRLRVGNRNWKPTSVGESSAYASGAVSNQRYMVFSLPARLARAFAAQAGTDPVRLRADAFQLGAATHLDTDRTSAAEVWIVVTMTNEGAEPVLMVDPAGDSTEDLGVVVLHDGKDVTLPVQVSHELQLTDMQWFQPGGVAEIRLSLSSLADVTTPGRYEVSIAVPVDIMPLPQYMEGDATSVPENWTIHSLVHSSFSFRRSQDGTTVVAD